MAENLITIGNLSDGEFKFVIEAANTLYQWLKNDAAVPNDAPFRKILNGVMIHLAFFEPSTRTRVSFETAAKLLGATTITFSSADSSIVKGESLEDTALTLLAMSPHIIVMRHPHTGSAQRLADYLPIPIVNGGDGRGHHPTQALLDAATIHNDKPIFDIANKLHIAIVGDIINSRVARSNAELWTRLGHKITLVAPKPFLPKLTPYKGIKLTSDFDSVLPAVDAVMMLRMQKERLEAGSTGAASLISQYALNNKRLSLLKPDALILHPGPCNRGIELDDSVYKDSRCRIREQVRFGVAVRMIVLAMLAGRQDRLTETMDLIK